jgi:hypothetical protein
MKMTLLGRIGAAILLGYAWLAGQIRAQAQRIGPRLRDDRGDALGWAALALGGVVLAIVVIIVARQKATTIVSNICTNPDPTTCSTK